MTPAQKAARAARANAQRAQTGRDVAAAESNAPSQAKRRGGPIHSRIWRERIIPAVIRRDAGLCHLCLAMGCQATGADSADHHPVPASECEARGISILDASNLRAVHHKACAFCGVRCNVVKANGSMEAFRLNWERQTGRQAVEPGSSSSEPEGRPW